MSADQSVLTIEQVRHVAKLARLRLGEAQLELYREQLGSILQYVRKLQELDVTGVEPIAHPTDAANRLDPDLESSPMTLEALIANAPASADRYLAVPKVLGEGGG